jgi:DNA-binding winged helix-turn-helix (wHTH) protein/tetratricopeptide (TPR) repeat protein
MNNSVTVPDSFQLGPFKIKANENTLSSDDGETTLLPKVMALLVYLCRHPQQVVTFDELNAAIWPNEVVGDNAIYNLVGQLRKVLGDSASNPTYIQTVSKVGYRLLVDAKPLHAKPLITKTTDASTTDEKTKLIGVAVVLSIMFACMAVLLFSQLQPNSSLSPDSQRQLKLASYQLYRGDAQGIDQAINTLQQLTVTEPKWDVPKTELAYAFLRKARLEPTNKPFWLNKAHVISQDQSLVRRGGRLAVLIDVLQGKELNLEEWKELLEDELLTSERLAFGQTLFEKGYDVHALEQMQLAQQSCLDCPYLYRRLASIQLSSGDIEAGFNSFSHYQMLLNRTGDDPIHNAGYVPLNLNRLQQMADWHSQTLVPETLLNHQRNYLALFYLSLGRIDNAEQLLTTTPDESSEFFDLYTHAAIAGAQSDFEQSLILLKKRQTLFPDNQRFKLSVVYALWQLHRYEDAIRAFNEFEIINESAPWPDIMAFSTWSVYAALLLKTDNVSLGQKILQKLEHQLQAGLIPGSQQADIRLASVKALLGKREQALEQLEIAIKQGWVSDFNHSWWYIQDSPYFSALREDERFQTIVARYHQGIANMVN